MSFTLPCEDCGIRPPVDEGLCEVCLEWKYLTDNDLDNHDGEPLDEEFERVAGCAPEYAGDDDCGELTCWWDV